MPGCSVTDTGTLPLLDALGPLCGRRGLRRADYGGNFPSYLPEFNDHLRRLVLAGHPVVNRDDFLSGELAHAADARETPHVSESHPHPPSQSMDDSRATAPRARDGGGVVDVVDDDDAARRAANEAAWQSWSGYVTSSGCACWDATPYPCIPKSSRGFGFNPNLYALLCCCLCARRRPT